MTIHHHPSDATLMAYGAGSLPEGLALAVATHLAFCPLCREHTETVEAMGGALLDDIAPAVLDDAALTAALARLEDLDPMEPMTETAPPPTGAGPEKGIPLPSPLVPYLGARLPDSRWRWLAPGIRHIEVIPRDRQGGNVRLLRIAPGMELPVHGHRGIELTTVLSGSFSDEIGRFAAGDLAEVDDDVSHTPISDTAEDCICLIATQAPLQFHGLAPRLLQPFLKL